MSAPKLVRFGSLSANLTTSKLRRYQNTARTSGLCGSSLQGVVTSVLVLNFVLTQPASSDAAMATAPNRRQIRKRVCRGPEFRRFRALNDAYRAKFAFPFILAVSGRSRSEILAAFEARLGNDRDGEFRTALAEIDRIASIRLHALAP